jgi:hypothetical protein
VAIYPVQHQLEALALVIGICVAACGGGASDRPPLPSGPPVDPNVALLKQAKDGDVEGIEASLKAGADANFVPDPVGAESPLIYAARRGHVAAVRLLLQHGALPNMRTTDETPLHAAAARGHAEVVALLLAWGAVLSPESDKCAVVWRARARALQIRTGSRTTAARAAFAVTKRGERSQPAGALLVRFTPLTT